MKLTQIERIAAIEEENILEKWQLASLIGQLWTKDMSAM